MFSFSLLDSARNKQDGALEVTTSALNLHLDTFSTSSKTLDVQNQTIGCPKFEGSENAKRIFALQQDYIATIDAVMLFLQGKNQNLARQICSFNFLPQASRLSAVADLEWAFGNMGIQDQAKHLATLYLEDLSDFIVECIDPNFGFSRYAERLGRSANSFDELSEALQSELSYIDHISLEILEKRLQTVQPNMVCFSVPFPGNLYSSFRCAQWIKKHHPNIKVAMGGGFPNTELRSISDKRVFEYFDFITLDDGELPIELLLKQLQQGTSELKRTFLLEDEMVTYKNNSLLPDYKQAEVGTPDYSDLLLSRYISVIEIANPMHSLWSDGRWNKLTMAHGCYWAKCSFCDVSLDYIKLYEPVTAKLLVDRIEELISQTGETGFHFVDEAAPPALMRELALEIIKRKLTVSWWTNIRFEKSFSRDLCILLKASGCIAVSGGLEVASDRLLQLIDKGTTVEQVAQVTRNLTEAGVMVHAYLMYGYPTQTVQETVDSLEMVRQLFELGILQSGFWHQFALTAHSPIGLNPQQYGVTPELTKITFANNDIAFTDETGIQHEQFSEGLKKSLYNFMHDIGFDMNLQEWFDFKIPSTQIAPNFIENCLEKENPFQVKPTAKIIWTGNAPSLQEEIKTKKGNTFYNTRLFFHTKTEAFDLLIPQDQAEWLVEMLQQTSIFLAKKQSFAAVKASYEKQFSDFELFWFSKAINKLKKNGLLVL
ncbi:MAG: radical SAM protein [Flavobacteriales bacterium]|nr:radical SAM protein [Flavobacteriales bacterium]